MIELKIDVTHQDINDALQACDGSASNSKADLCTICPIAQAIHRVTGCKAIVVGGDALYDSNSPEQKEIGCLPYLASCFVANFDSGYAVEPFSFKVELPDEYAPTA